jgi:hypothetical protein
MSLALAGCTLVKPIVCAVTGPICILGGGGFGGCWGNGDGRGVVVIFGMMVGVGVVGGLVTGVISDINALAGKAENPTANWYNPLRTNRNPER